MPSMQMSDVTPERLRRLAGFRAPGGSRVVSLYLNLDPAANLAAPVNRRTAVTSLLDEAHRAVEGAEGLDHDARMALREDVARVREALAAHLDDEWAEGAHALALFACRPAGLLEVVKLPRPVEQRVHVAERPVIVPLVELGPAEPWAVLLVDGNDARLLEGRGDRLAEVWAATTDHGGRTARGGMSAQRYARSVGMEENEFLRAVAETLRAADERRHFGRILVGAGERHFGILRDRLPQPLRERIVARFDAGADWESARDVRAKVEPLLQVAETRREGEALRELERAGVRGLVDTLPALYERRVDTLLIEPGVERPGVVCPRCGYASAEERAACPVDGEQMEPHPNVVEWAVERAVEQDATVLPLRHHEDLAGHDGVGATLRY